jgi:hypothetical protein
MKELRGEACFGAYAPRDRGRAILGKLADDSDSGVARSAKLWLAELDRPPQQLNNPKN